MVRQNQRVTRLLSPATRQKAERAKKTFQQRMFLSAGEVDCYREAYKAVQSEFGHLSSTDMEVLMYPIIYDTLQDTEKDMKDLSGESGKLNRAKLKLRRQISETRQQTATSESKPQRNLDIQTVKKPVKPQVTVYHFKSQPEMKKTTYLGITYPKTPEVPELPDTDKLTTAGLKAILDDLEGKLDGINEMSELTALRLQMTMDRRSKFISTLSRMMKKISTTQDTLVQNIK